MAKTLLLTRLCSRQTHDPETHIMNGLGGFVMHAERRAAANGAGRHGGSAPGTCG